MTTTVTPITPIDWDLPSVQDLCRPFDDGFAALVQLDEFAADIEMGCDGIHPSPPTRAQYAEWLQLRREVAERITSMAGRCSRAGDRARVERNMRDIVDIITDVSTAAGAYHFT